MKNKNTLIYISVCLQVLSILIQIIAMSMKNLISFEFPMILDIVTGVIIDILIYGVALGLILLGRKHKKSKSLEILSIVVLLTIQPLIGYISGWITTSVLNNFSYERRINYVGEWSKLNMTLSYIRSILGAWCADVLLIIEAALSIGRKQKEIE